jgi:hypothetical protein
MSSIFGYDRGGALSSTQLKSLATYEGGKFSKFFIRYLAESYSWKYFSWPEVERLLAEGYMIGSVFEDGADSINEGYEAGKAAAGRSKATAIRVGQPKKSGIFYAVDYDAPASDYDAIEAFLKGAQEVLGDDFFAGVYGKYDVIEEMGKRKACKYFWQTLAWSRGKLSEFADMYQYKIDTPANGINVDFNECFNPEFLWGQYKEPVPVPPVVVVPPKIVTLSMYDDVPVDHWAASAIEKAFKKNFMSGVSDRKFGLNQEVTREQLAVALDKAGLLESDAFAKTSASLVYSDVPESHWAASAIMKAFNKNVMSGVGGGKFGLGEELTREQFTTVLANLGLITMGESYWKIPDIYTDVPSDHWAVKSIKNAYLKGVIVGVGEHQFGMGEAVMREQLAKVFDNMGKLD